MRQLLGMARPNRPPHPLKRTAENIAEILKRLSHGESLRAICADEHLPAYQTFLEWCAEDAELADQYARARERQADHYASEIIEIADIEEDPQRARVRIDARKWVASKLLPKKYGDRQEIEHSGKLESIVVNVIRKEPPK